MAKRKRPRNKKLLSDQQDSPATTPQEKEEQPNKSGRTPLWLVALAFLVPLILSELMFYAVGRIASMILFPVAWIGLWALLMYRSDWQVLKNRKRK